jgi:hypothetical protein
MFISYSSDARARSPVDKVCASVAADAVLTRSAETITRRANLEGWVVFIK